MKVDMIYHYGNDRRVFTNVDLVTLGEYEPDVPFEELKHDLQHKIVVEYGWWTITGTSSPSHP